MRSVEKIGYLLDTLHKRLHGSGLGCPDCGSTEFEVVDRKFVVTELRRCGNCMLLYRAPTDTPAENEGFYQLDYVEGFTTDLPNDGELQRLLDARFEGGEKCFSDYIRVLEALGAAPGARLFDYGCSWGYGSWQFARHGYSVTSYEISRPRAEFARRKLGVACLAERPRPETVGVLAHTFDVFFSSHVLEHVPSPRSVVALAQALLKPGGLFVAFTPNGSAQFRAADPLGWRTLWGKVHPNVLDEVYYRALFKEHPIYFDTSPVNAERLAVWANGRESSVVSLNGSELLCVARF